jgi:NTP pyrophosphatase (non-canonical NTP hydrolase)
MKCHTNLCSDEAIYIVYWPGKVPVPQFCEYCKNRAITLSLAMGFVVQVERIKETEVEEKPSVKRNLESYFLDALHTIQDSCGEISREHGFWVNKDSPDRLLMLMVGELSEAHEDLRNGRTVNEVYYEKKEGTLKPCGFGVELADCIIRIFDAAAQLEIDLPELILQKMEYNRSRPHLHGRKF